MHIVLYISVISRRQLNDAHDCNRDPIPLHAQRASEVQAETLSRLVTKHSGTRYLLCKADATKKCRHLRRQRREFDLLRASDYNFITTIWSDFSYILILDFFIEDPNSVFQSCLLLLDLLQTLWNIHFFVRRLHSADVKSTCSSRKMERAEFDRADGCIHDWYYFMYVCGPRPFAHVQCRLRIVDTRRRKKVVSEHFRCMQVKLKPFSSRTY